MTPAIGKTVRVVSFNTLCANIARTCVVLGMLCSGRLLFSAEANEVYLLSTRSIGTVCQSEVMLKGLKCIRYNSNPSASEKWATAHWQDSLDSAENNLQTIIYVHGNRVASGEDRARGMMVYRSLIAQGKPKAPIRFIIWSWPSSTIPGPLKDYQVKANRTRPVSWQFAWYLNHLTSQSPTSIIGYSYGARVTSGAMHLLGGGSLGNLKISNPADLPTFRIALVAAAFDAHWLQPGHFHGRAVSQVDHLTLTVNPLDPAMRFYHLSNGRGRVHALGRLGISNPRSLGSLSKRVHSLNLTKSVGRSHYLTDYLAATSNMRVIWRNLLQTNVRHDKGKLAVNTSTAFVE